MQVFNQSLVGDLILRTPLSQYLDRDEQLLCVGLKARYKFPSGLSYWNLHQARAFVHGAVDDEHIVVVLIQNQPKVCQWASYARLWAFSLLTLMLGFVFFQKTRKGFADVV